MKNNCYYETPTAERVTLGEADVISASPGTVGPTVDAPGGIWDLEID